MLINLWILQCVIYDTDESNARLIGVEYVIKEEIFATLPPEEKKLWHSHEYEVRLRTSIFSLVARTNQLPFTTGLRFVSIRTH